MENIAAYLARVRRALHQIPETAFEEFETQKFIKSELSAMGIPLREVGTGIIADLNFGAARTLAFRADMDALPIRERSGADYCSRRPGRMHACGHDGHMAILLAFARECTGMGEMPVNLRFLFQPGEEGEGGAVRMIEAGALEGVDEIYALHLDPSLEGGTVGLSAGPSLAGDYEFDVRFEGESAHCAEKSRGRDALLAACEFVCALPGLAGKGNSVLHAGRLEGGAARNVVAGSAVVSGSMRYFEKRERDRLKKLMEFQLGYLRDRYGVKGRIETVTEYIPLVNNRGVVDKLKGISNFVMLERRWLSEDFAFCLEKVKGALIWLGVRREPETKLHADDFDFDERHLAYGVELYLKLLDIERKNKPEN